VADKGSLFVPDRYDVLQRRAGVLLQAFVAPVEDSLKQLDEKFRDMKGAGRGGFLILRGDSGAGKSTFLHTVHLFRRKTEEFAIAAEQPIVDALRKSGRTTQDLRILVLEGREALQDVEDAEIEAGLHAINTFIRSEQGENTLVVWPTNTDELTARLVAIAKKLGADALLGIGEPVFKFHGPAPEQFHTIAQKTIAALNGGASLIDLGVSEIHAKDLVGEAQTIGMYMSLIRRELLKNEALVSGLIAQEQCRVWVVIASGSEPDGDVSSLTRGSASTADIDKLLSATNANVVQELKLYPERLGILATVLDAKILHLPVITALAIARTYGDKNLHAKMEALGMTVKPDSDALDRLLNSELGLALVDQPVGPRKVGGKPGSNTLQAFEKLAQIASKDDVTLNRAIGRGLLDVNLINDFAVEQDFGNGLTRRTDIVCDVFPSPVRLEVMWRSKSGRADIANYVLTKLQNYGRASKFFE
jgi:hypothetical protein